MKSFFSFSGLDISYSGSSPKNNSLIIKGVSAVGVVPSHAGKVCTQDPLVN